MNTNLISFSALWKQESENGEAYFKGYFGAQELVIFDNRKKESEKHPDKKAYIRTKASDYVELFSLWTRKMKTGDDFFTGSLNQETDIIGFLTKNKKNEKAPDLKIYVKQKQQKEQKQTKQEFSQEDDEMPF